jgi:hypothetical protein
VRGLCEEVGIDRIAPAVRSPVPRSTDEAKLRWRGWLAVLAETSVPKVCIEADAGAARLSAL